VGEYCSVNNHVEDGIDAKTGGKARRTQTKSLAFTRSKNKKVKRRRNGRSVGWGCGASIEERETYRGDAN